jgi:hypothetical protein
MIRTIEIPIPVYAAIWSARRDGENTEGEILARLLSCAGAVESASTDQPKAPTNADAGGSGFFDTRNGVHFPEGFEIFRDYKGREYRARANNGIWLRLDTGQRYRSLNQLNGSFAEGPENVWNGSWRYLDNGRVRSINALR